MEKCNKFQHQELLYVYNELSPDEQSHFEAHLRECPNCREQLEISRQIISKLEPIELQPSLKCQQRIKSLISHSPITTQRLSILNYLITSLRKPQWSTAASFASVILVIGIAFIIINQTPQLPNESQPLPKKSTVTHQNEDTISSELSFLTRSARALELQWETTSSQLNYFENQIEQIEDNIYQTQTSPQSEMIQDLSEELIVTSETVPSISSEITFLNRSTKALELQWESSYVQPRYSENQLEQIEDDIYQLSEKINTTPLNNKHK